VALNTWDAPAPAVPHARPRRGVNAKSLLRTICGEYMHSTSDWTWTQTLVHALTLFGVDEPAARRALLRTADEGWLERRQDGRRVSWRLTPTGRGLTMDARDRVFAFSSGRSDWNDEWLFLLLTTRDERKRNLARRRLAWAGFGWLSTDLMISPHVEREPEAARILDELDMELDAVSFRASIGAIGASKHVITEAWDLDDLAGRYADFVGLPGRLASRSAADVFVACTQLVHEWRRFVYLDPGLPLEFLPPKWIGLEARRVFDRHYARWQPPAGTWFDRLNAEQNAT
jgi:phenylacetic acid degradation operon negative regulatory protein